MPRTVLFALLLFPLLLGGCAVGDGIAQAVKWTSKKTSGSGNDSAAAAPAPAAPADHNPPPPPVAAPRDEIKVESLPPSR